MVSEDYIEIAFPNYMISIPYILGFIQQQKIFQNLI